LKQEEGDGIIYLGLPVTRHPPGHHAGERRTFNLRSCVPMKPSESRVPWASLPDKLDYGVHYY